MNKKNILVNAYTHLNLGDDLFLKILFEKYPDVHFTLIGNQDNYKNVFKTDNISYFFFPKTWLDIKLPKKILNKFFKFYYLKARYIAKERHLKNSKLYFDATVTIGGSIFMEKTNTKHNKLSMHRMLCEVFPGKPKFIIGSNFGPYKNQSFVDYYNELFKNYTDVCFRDSYSKSLFKDLNNVRCLPDVVFSANFKDVEKTEKTVGFSVIDLSHREGLSQFKHDYQNMIVELVNLYIGRGFTPYLYSFCEYEGDERAINNIIELLNEENAAKVRKVYYKGDIEQFMEKYSKMEIMYPTRFHAMILSMMFEQKIHPIIYSKKMANVLVDMEYMGDFTDLKKISESNAASTTFDIEFSFNYDVKQSALKQFEAFEKYINS